MGDYSDLIHVTHRLVFVYTQNKKEVDLLEIGCGTGNILKTLPKNFQIYGLDVSADMVEIAKKKIKHGTFWQADMTQFSISKKFDVILCIFDTINHLNHFSQWEHTFQRAAKHLKSNGVFIFDMNTIKRLEELVDLPAYVKKDKNQLLCAKVLRAGNNLYNARFEIFSDVTKEKVDIIEENGNESAFSIKRVKHSLEKYFKIEKMVDPYRETIGKNTGRIFFVCKKR